MGVTDLLNHLINEKCKSVDIRDDHFLWRKDIAATDKSIIINSAENLLLVPF